MFDGEQACMSAFSARAIGPGDVLVISNEGPAGGPGMREMLSVTSAGRRRRTRRVRRPLIDGRFSGITRDLMVGHVALEAVHGGPLAIVRDGETVTIDADAGLLSVAVSVDDLASRIVDYEPQAGALPGVLGGYSRLVGSASDGATLA